MEVRKGNVAVAAVVLYFLAGTFPGPLHHAEDEGDGEFTGINFCRHEIDVRKLFGTAALEN